MEEVTATQAASLSGVSERTIRRRIAAGQLPARRVAPNRFAIKVQDLTIHHGFDDLALRLEVLERRVVMLELRQQVVLRTRTESAASAAAGLEGDVSLSQLHLLLAELARETERLAPLLGATIAAGANPDAEASGREQLHAMRHGHGGSKRA